MEKSYKKDRGERQRVVGEIVKHARCVGLGPGHRATLRHEDDAIDALVCALVARLVSDVDGPTSPAVMGFQGNPGHLKEEGWIHLPSNGDKLRDLC